MPDLMGSEPNRREIRAMCERSSTPEDFVAISLKKDPVGAADIAVRDDIKVLVLDHRGKAIEKLEQWLRAYLERMLAHIDCEPENFFTILTVIHHEKPNEEWAQAECQEELDWVVAPSDGSSAIDHAMELHQTIRELVTTVIEDDCAEERTCTAMQELPCASAHPKQCPGRRSH